MSGAAEIADTVRNWLISVARGENQPNEVVL